MAAPLCDNRGRVRYYIGCQLDVTGLVEEGRGVESFAHLLAEDRHQEQQQERQGNGGPITGSHTKDPMKTLGELGQMLSLDESNLIHNPSQRNSMCDDVSIAGSMVGRPNSRRENTSRNSTRRVLGEDEHQREDGDWALSSTGLSGKLPGVYQNVNQSSLIRKAYSNLPKGIRSQTVMLTLNTVSFSSSESFLTHHLPLPIPQSSRAITVSFSISNRRTCPSP